MEVVLKRVKLARYVFQVTNVVVMEYGQVKSENVSVIKIISV